MSAPHIDLHNHVLPGVDDGPEDVSEAVELVAALVDVGFAEIHPTPHQKAGSWTPTEAERTEAVTALRDGVAAAGIDVTIHEPAGENMWDSVFIGRQEDDSYPTYAGDKAFLVELPPAEPPPFLMDRLFALRLSGRLPVMAHVERYQVLITDDDVARALGEKAALLVNLPALGGRGGWRVRRLARRLVRQGLVHAATSDAHDVRDAEHSRRGIEWLKAKMGDDTVEYLLSEGPRHILAGEIPQW